MTIALQPEQEQFIQAQLATRRYASATEVIAEALHLLEKRKHCVSLRGGANCRVEDLRIKIDIAAAQSDRGEVIYGSKTSTVLVVPLE